MPDRRDQVVLADHALPVADQIFQQVEHLRLDRNQIGAAAQLAPVGIEGTIRKEIAQFSAPQRWLLWRLAYRTTR